MKLFLFISVTACLVQHILSPKPTPICYQKTGLVTFFKNINPKINLPAKAILTSPVKPDASRRVKELTKISCNNIQTQDNYTCCTKSMKLALQEWITNSRAKICQPLSVSVATNAYRLFSLHNLIKTWSKNFKADILPETSKSPSSQRRLSLDIPQKNVSLRRWSALTFQAQTKYNQSDYLDFINQANKCFYHSQKQTLGSSCSYCADSGEIRNVNENLYRISRMDAHKWLNACGNYVIAANKFYSYAVVINFGLNMKQTIPYVEPARKFELDQQKACVDDAKNCQSDLLNDWLSRFFLDGATKLDQQFEQFVYGLKSALMQKFKSQNDWQELGRKKQEICKSVTRSQNSIEHGKVMVYDKITDDLSTLDTITTQKNDYYSWLGKAAGLIKSTLATQKPTAGLIKSTLATQKPTAKPIQKILTPPPAPKKPEAPHNKCSLAPMYGLSSSNEDILERKSNICPSVSSSCCSESTFKKMEANWKQSVSNNYDCNGYRMNITKILVIDLISNMKKKFDDMTSFPKYKTVQKQLKVASEHYPKYTVAFEECELELQKLRAHLLCTSCDIDALKYINVDTKKITVPKNYMDNLFVCYKRFAYEEKYMVPLQKAWYDLSGVYINQNIDDIVYKVYGMKKLNKCIKRNEKDESTAAQSEDCKIFEVYVSRIAQNWEISNNYKLNEGWNSVGQLLTNVGKEKISKIWKDAQVAKCDSSSATKTSISDDSINNFNSSWNGQYQLKKKQNRRMLDVRKIRKNRKNRKLGDVQQKLPKTDDFTVGDKKFNGWEFIESNDEKNGLDFRKYEPTGLIANAKLFLYGFVSTLLLVLFCGW